MVGCGYPGRQDGVRVVIVDCSSDQSVKISRDCLVGEIWVDSPSKVRSYLFCKHALIRTRTYMIIFVIAHLMVSQYVCMHACFRR